MIEDPVKVTIYPRTLIDEILISKEIEGEKINITITIAFANICSLLRYRVSPGEQKVRVEYIYNLVKNDVETDEVNLHEEFHREIVEGIELYLSGTYNEEDLKWTLFYNLYDDRLGSHLQRLIMR
ncbi:hypothetical protein L3N51_01643 [Metallosphaera sp. J1]|uniref:hypothetical protein n=1 Tax=Metallosphaera javensis (ex Hofmann et al. 2022) TaxID=99938 RepID=UPI001EE0D801|nr:hypothetical protein [Metallosphaera javensis (ex Hofmann et al. 2022)]MCG3109353.1 hypothetical protein [Metallosphaera javensis (ex Hofmann et al. 2022)]